MPTQTITTAIAATSVAAAAATTVAKELLERNTKVGLHETEVGLCKTEVGLCEMKVGMHKQVLAEQELHMAHNKAAKIEEWAEKGLGELRYFMCEI